MSLINDMLRNLEAKRPDDLARQNLQREIRTLPAAASGRAGVWRWLLALGVLAPLLAVGFLHANGRLLPRLGIDPAATPLPVVAAPAVAVPTPAPVEAPVANVAEPLRLASSLEFVPLPVSPVLAVPDPVALPVSVPKTDAAAPVAEAPKLVSAAPAGPVRIEKSPVMATPRDRADAEYRRAEGALASGRSGEVVESLRAALKHDPAYVPVRQMLLRQLLEMRKTDEAMAVLQEGLEVQPMQTGWAMSLARLQLEQNDLAAADRTLSRSQVYGEANADYAGFQGHLKSRLGVPRLAVAHYQRAVRLAPNEGRWWLGLGLALEADGHAPEAREALKRSLATATLSADLATVAEQHLR